MKGTDITIPLAMWLEGFASRCQKGVPTREQLHSEARSAASCFMDRTFDAENEESLKKLENFLKSRNFTVENKDGIFVPDTVKR